MIKFYRNKYPNWYFVGEDAFSGYTNLTEVIILDIITSIPKGGFNNCPNLTKIKILNSVNSIEDLLSLIVQS